MTEEYKSLNKPSPGNLFDSMFTSKWRQDPLHNDLFVPSVKTVIKGKRFCKIPRSCDMEHSSISHQATRFFREVLRFNKKTEIWL